MRVSALRTSPHYVRNAQVLLDGRPMSFAVEADDVAGWVEVVDLDREAPDSTARGLRRFATKRLWGAVEIQEPPL